MTKPKEPTITLDQLIAGLKQYESTIILSAEGLALALMKSAEEAAKND